MDKSAKEKIKELRHLRDESKNSYGQIYGPTREPRYNKRQFYFSTEKPTPNLQDVIYFCHCHGVFGVNDVQPSFDSELSKYIAKAIDRKKAEIFNLALSIIDEEVKGMVSNLKKEKESLEEMIKEIEGEEENAQ